VSQKFLSQVVVHQRVTPRSLSLVPIYTPGWEKTMEVRFVPYENDTTLPSSDQSCARMRP